MPVDPQQLHDAIRKIGQGLAVAEESIYSARESALRILRAAAASPDRLVAVVNTAASADPTLRCALPLEENFSIGFPRPPVPGAPALLATDGSQILTDRHEEILFAVINIGAVIIEPGSGRAPRVLVDSRILFGDQLYGPSGMLLSEGDLALVRDAAERRSLLANAPAGAGSVVLSDGPLELWGAKDVSEPRAFEHALRQYLQDLRELHRSGCTVAGYVDKPAADLVVRMLELAEARPGALPNHQDLHPLHGASDRWIFSQILRPGERSAIFCLQSSSRARYVDDLALHFFYLNVARDSRPALARVEIPWWVAQDRGRVDALHQSLLEQCHILGARPYPYILHRAHETASISQKEREQIKLRLLLEMRDHRVEPDPVSGKASAKQASGKDGRY